LRWREHREMAMNGRSKEKTGHPTWK
jgi:hypothetical protein